MLLACARGLGERLDTFSFAFPGDIELIDSVVGGLLARRAGYAHRHVDIGTTTAEERDRYLARTGYAGSPGKATDFYKAVAGSLDPDCIWLIGYAGEVGRAFYWTSDDHAGTQLSAADLLERMNLPADPVFVTAMEEWLASYPDMDATAVLDFLYHEQRMGAWAAPHLYGVAPIRNALTPFSSRAIMKVMHRLPPDFKRRQQLARVLIEKAWPELLALPFQRIPGVGGSLHHLRHRKVGPAVNRLIDSVGRQQGKSRAFDRLYVGARSVYRKLRT